VVVELPGWEMHVIGTATLICGHLAVTAKHVLDAIIREFGAKQSSKGTEIDGYSVRLYQVLPGPITEFGTCSAHGPAQVILRYCIWAYIGPQRQRRKWSGGCQCSG
jgi:hypothetical protein